MSAPPTGCATCGTPTSARYCTPPCRTEARNRRRREQRRHDARQRAARHAAMELLTWGDLWDGEIPTITAAHVVAKTNALYGNYRMLQDLSVEEATEALVAVLERYGLPLVPTAQQQAPAACLDAMLATHTGPIAETTTAALAHAVGA